MVGEAGTGTGNGEMVKLVTGTGTGDKVAGEPKPGGGGTWRGDVNSGTCGVVGVLGVTDISMLVQPLHFHLISTLVLMAVRYCVWVIPVPHILINTSP